jgi:hypothetical protein
MRKPVRFLHILLPRVKDVKFLDDKQKEIVGEFDLSEGYDPFDTYDEDPNTAPHVVLTELEHDPFAALKFIRTWGPFRLSGSDGADPTDDGIDIEEYVRAMSHPAHPRRKTSPDGPITFRTNIQRFFLQQSEVRNLMHLWIAFRDGNLKHLKHLLRARIAQPVREYEDEPPEGYKDYLDRRQLIEAALSADKHKPIVNLTAWLISDHFARHTTWLWLRPCLEILTYHFDEDYPEFIEANKNPQASGFRMGLHIDNLIDAIYMMIWQDISGANIGETCPNCHKLFIPARSNMRYCSVPCRERANSKQHYRRKTKGT